MCDVECSQLTLILDGIAFATIGSLMNYLLLGLGPNIDQFYLHSFEILLACVVVFPGVGNLGYTLLEYRLGHRSLLGATFENLRWVPFLYVIYLILLTKLLNPCAACSSSVD